MGKKLTDGEADILREQEQDVRGLDPDAGEADADLPSVPYVGDLYRAWEAATAEWYAREADVAKANIVYGTARTKARGIEQQLGEAALADVPRENGRCRWAWVVMAGRLYHVEETGNEADGWRYEVRAVPVRKLEV